MWLYQLKAEEEEAQNSASLLRNIGTFTALFVVARVAAALLNDQ